MIDQPALTVREWNACHPIGTPVVAYPGARPEDIPDAQRLDTHPRTHAAATADALGAYNHATHDAPGPDWQTPNDAYDATGSLTLTAMRLPQALRQTAALLEHVEAQGRLYSVDNNTGDYPESLAHLEAAADAATQCHQALTAAQRAMSSLAYRTDDEGF